MGKLTNGINGPHVGKAGRLISYMLNGQNVTRTIGINNKPKTIAQKNNMMGMKLINDLFYYMEPFIMTSFGPSARGTVYNFQNLSVRYNKPRALKGYYPNLEVDYSKVTLSVGNLPMPVDARVERTDEGFKFSWNPTSHPKWPECDDQVMLLAYPPGYSKEVLYKTRGAIRSEGFDFLPVPANCKDMTMEVYMTFVNDERTDVSNSIYLGRIEP